MGQSSERAVLRLQTDTSPSKQEITNTSEYSSEMPSRVRSGHLQGWENLSIYRYKISGTNARTLFDATISYTS